MNTQHGHLATVLMAAGFKVTGERAATPDTDAVVYLDIEGWTWHVSAHGAGRYSAVQHYKTGRFGFSPVLRGACAVVCYLMAARKAVR